MANEKGIQQISRNKIGYWEKSQAFEGGSNSYFIDLIKIWLKARNIAV